MGWGESLLGLACGPPVLGREGGGASSSSASEQLRVMSSSCEVPGTGCEAAGHRYSTSEHKDRRGSQREAGAGRDAHTGATGHNKKRVAEGGKQLPGSPRQPPCLGQVPTDTQSRGERRSSICLNARSHPLLPPRFPQPLYPAPRPLTCPALT